MSQESPTHMEQKRAFDLQKDQRMQNKESPFYLMKNRNIPQFTPTVSRVIILTALC